MAITETEKAQYAEEIAERAYHGLMFYIYVLLGLAITIGIVVAISYIFNLIYSIFPAELWKNPWIRGTLGALAWAVIIGVGGLYLTLVERKVMARIQTRYGPNRWGPYGILQPIADAIKLLGKEDIVPKNADKPVFRLAPIVAFAPTFVAFAVIPVTAALITVRLEIGVLFYIAMTSLAPIGAIMAGWGPNNKWNLLGGLRFAAQMLSYEIPLVLALLGPIMLAQSLDLITIVEKQSSYWLGFIPRWYIFLQPLGFAVFFISFMAESGRVPFDIPDAESELVQGWTTEYSGMKFVLLLLVEYVHLIGGSILTVILFLGGWHGPGFLPPLAWFTIKLMPVIFLMLLIRAVHFRTRIDQLLAIGWKFLLPLALINIGITSIALTI